MFRVLITDRHAGLCEAVGQLLRQHFPRIEINEVSHGQQDLPQLDGVDLLFLDPRQNGLEFAAKIKAEHPALALSVLTMPDAPEYRQAAFEHGADYFVSKEAPAERILEVVRSAIAGIPEGQAGHPREIN